MTALNLLAYGFAMYGLGLVTGAFARLHRARGRPGPASAPTPRAPEPAAVRVAANAGRVPVGAHHMHCYRDQHATECRYGDPTCPAAPRRAPSAFPDLYPRLELANPATASWDDVERLSLYHPHVREAVTLVGQRHLTQQAALITLLYRYVDMWQQQRERELTHLMNQPPTPERPL